MKRGRFHTTQVPSTPHCPACQSRIGAVTSVDGGTVPAAGDVSCCSYCAATLVFIDSPRGLALRLATDAERAEIRADPTYAMAEWAVLALIARRGG